MNPEEQQAYQARRKIIHNGFTQQDRVINFEALLPSKDLAYLKRCRQWLDNKIKTLEEEDR